LFLKTDLNSQNAANNAHPEKSRRSTELSCDGADKSMQDTTWIETTRAVESVNMAKSFNLARWPPKSFGELSFGEGRRQNPQRIRTRQKLG
jgi:hypothetical protein